MSSREKRLEQWKNNTPRDEPVDTVKAMISYHFSNVQQKGSSHIVIKDKRLIEKSVTEIAGILIIPVSGGQKVKGAYLKKLALAIEIIEGKI